MSTDKSLFWSRFQKVVDLVTKAADLVADAEGVVHELKNDMEMMSQEPAPPNPGEVKVPKRRGDPKEKKQAESKLGLRFAKTAAADGVDSLTIYVTGKKQYSVQLGSAGVRVDLKFSKGLVDVLLALATDHGSGDQPASKLVPFKSTAKLQKLYAKLAGHAITAGAFNEKVRRLRAVFKFAAQTTGQVNVFLIESGTHGRRFNLRKGGKITFINENENGAGAVPSPSTPDSGPPPAALKKIPASEACRKAS